jgi:6-phosphofructokinase
MPIGACGDCHFAASEFNVSRSALPMPKMGVPLVGVPKTIDNDIVETTNTFGFDTAVSFATEAIDPLHTTAEAHHRIIVVEVMGRSLATAATLRTRSPKWVHTESRGSESRRHPPRRRNRARSSRQPAAADHVRPHARFSLRVRRPGDQQYRNEQRR